MQLETERLILRECAPTDVAGMHQWHSDPRYLDYPWNSMTPEDSAEMVDRFIGWKNECPRHRWQLAIVLMDAGVLIGTCGLRTDHIDATTGDVGYELDPVHWGHGYATEALRRIIAFGFDQGGLDEVTARVVCSNRRSIQVLERLDFRHREDIPAGVGRDGRQWPERAEYVLQQPVSI